MVETAKTTQTQNLFNQWQTAPLPQASAKTESFDYSKPIFLHENVTRQIQETSEAQFTTNKVNKIYSQLQDIFTEYRIDMKDAKETLLLEKILGCSTEELATKRQEEIDIAIQALKDALGLTGHWKWFWQDRNKDDVEKIAEIAIEKKTMRATGVNYIEKIYHQLTTESSLKEELVKNGQIQQGEDVTPEAIKEYFRANCKALKKVNANSSAQEIEKAKAEALEEFGKLVIRYNTVEEKIGLVALIEELFAEQRTTGLDILINTNGTTENENAKKAESEIAFEASNQMVGIVGKEDVLGECLSDTDSTIATKVVYSSMTEEHAKKALENEKTRVQDLLNKENLTKEEENYVKRLKSITAGTVGGLAESENKDLVEKALTQAQTYGISQTDIDKIIKDTYGVSSNTYRKYQKSIESIEKQNNTKNETFVINNNESKTQTSNQNIEAIKTSNTSTVAKSHENKNPSQNPTLVTNSAQPDSKNNTTGVTTTKTIDNSVVASSLGNHLRNGGGLQDYLERHESGTITIMAEAFRIFDELNSDDKKIALEKYENLDKEDQIIMLENAGNSALAVLIQHTSTETIKELKVEDFNSYIAKDTVSRKQENLLTT